MANVWSRKDLVPPRGHDPPMQHNTHSRIITQPSSLGQTARPIVARRTKAEPLTWRIPGSPHRSLGLDLERALCRRTHHATKDRRRRQDGPMARMHRETQRMFPTVFCADWLMRAAQQRCQLQRPVAAWLARRAGHRSPEFQGPQLAATTPRTPELATTCPPSPDIRANRLACKRRMCGQVMLVLHSARQIPMAARRLDHTPLRTLGARSPHTSPPNKGAETHSSILFLLAHRAAPGLPEGDRPCSGARGRRVPNRKHAW